MMRQNKQIIKRVYNSKKEAKHNGQWKVAYADFMTAMMAFFLVMWLISMSSSEMRDGLANYFAPEGVSQNVTGTDGVLERGKTLVTEGNLETMSKGTDIYPDYVNYQGDATLELYAPRGTSETPNDDAPAADKTNTLIKANNLFETSSLDAKNQEQNKRSPGNGALANIVDDFEIHQAHQTLQRSIMDLNGDKAAEAIENVVVSITAEGIEIQISDDKEFTMFKSGSDELTDEARQTFSKLSSALQGLPYKIAIVGHTDAYPFVSRRNYTNWHLSSDRANAVSLAMLQAGLSSDRIHSITGRADTALKNQDDPFAAENRRVSIIVLRKEKVEDKSEKETAQDTSIAGAPNVTDADAMEMETDADMGDANNTP